MPVVRQTSATLPITAVAAVLDSVGAHLAAKLDAFGTDERTLTDELCDMACIWGQHAGHGPLTGPSLDLTLTKTTQQQEADVGADLALRVDTPFGTKRAMLQAKVLDPHSLRLRCDSSAGWLKLWGQLVLMRRVNGNLSFLLVYLPVQLLDGAPHGFNTWEQGFASPGSSSTPSSYGATVVAVDDLLDGQDRWRQSKPVDHVGHGILRPTGFSLTRLVLEMLACRRGSWGAPPPDSDAFAANPDAYPVRYVASRELTISVETDPDSWGAIQEDLDRALDDLP